MQIIQVVVNPCWSGWTLPLKIIRAVSVDSCVCSMQRKEKMKANIIPISVRSAAALTLASISFEFFCIHFGVVAVGGPELLVVFMMH